MKEVMTKTTMRIGRMATWIVDEDLDDATVESKEATCLSPAYNPCCQHINNYHA